MKKIMRIVKSHIVISIVFFVLSTPLFAQKSQSNETEKARSEMVATFGAVPGIFNNLPDHLVVSAWELFKDYDSPESAIPAKYSQLISLAVASQIPCDFCVYAHTTQAKMFGATNAEIQEAIATAANTRYWSTISNGYNVPFDEFKKHWDNTLAFMKKLREARK